MKKIALFFIITAFSGCSSINPLNLANLNATNVDIHINKFARSMGNKCYVETSESVTQRKNFCNCVEKTVTSNMKNKLSLNQIRQTLTGAAKGQQPLPNNKIVFSSIKQSCASALN